MFIEGSERKKNNLEYERKRRGIRHNLKCNIIRHATLEMPSIVSHNAHTSVYTRYIRTLYKHLRGEALRVGHTYECPLGACTRGYTP